MDNNTSLKIEMWFRKILGNVERCDYSVDSDAIRMGLAQWFYDNHEILLPKIGDNPTIDKWKDTLIGIGKSKSELTPDQLETFLEDISMS